MNKDGVSTCSCSPQRTLDLSSESKKNTQYLVMEEILPTWISRVSTAPVTAMMNGIELALSYDKF